MSLITLLKSKLVPYRAHSWTEKSVTLGIFRNVYFTRNGAAEIGFELFLAPSLMVDGQERDAIKSTVNVLLSQALPVGCRGRFIVDNSDLDLEDVQRCQLPLPDNEVLSELVASDNAALAAARQRGELRSLRHYLTVKVDRRVPKGRSLSERERDLLADYANALADRLQAALDAAGFAPRRMERQDIADLVYKYRNRQFGRMPAPFKSQVGTGPLLPGEMQATPEVDLPSPRRQLTESAVDKSNPGFLVVGNSVVNVVSWTNIEDGSTYSGMLEQLLGSLRDTDFFLIIDFDMVDPVKKKAMLSYKAEGAATSLAEGGASANRAISDEMEEALYSITRGRDKLVTFGVSMVIYAKTLDDLHEKTRRARAEMSQVGGALARVGNMDNIRQFELLEPFSGLTNQYLFDGRTTNVAGLIPQLGSWVGTPDPIVVLRNRHGGLVPINQAVGTTNSGTIVIGTAGSGKTNLNLTTLLNFCAVGGKGFVIDMKQDYVTATHSVDGEIIVFRPGARLPNGQIVCVNMFDLLPGQVRPDTDKRNLLMGLFKGMLLSSGGLAGLDYTILTSGIESAYERNVTRVQVQEGKFEERAEPFFLSDFVDYVRNLATVGGVAPDEDMRRAIKLLAARLSAFTGASPLGPFLDGPTTVKIGDVPITTFDISAMRDESARELRRIGMLLLTDLVWRAGIEMRDTLKMAIFEEVGAMMEIEEAADFMSMVFKVGRSYGFWPTATTQEIGDLTRLKGIINNSVLRFIGRVSADEAQHLADVLKLKNSTYDAIRGLGGGSNYREYVALLELSSGAVVGEVVRNYLTPLKYWLTTSDFNDVKRLNAVTERLGGNRLAAARVLAGVSNA